MSPTIDFLWCVQHLALSLPVLSTSYESNWTYSYIVKASRNICRSTKESLPSIPRSLGPASTLALTEGSDVYDFPFLLLGVDHPLLMPYSSNFLDISPAQKVSRMESTISTARASR
jgi:hypothetical protein